MIAESLSEIRKLLHEFDEGGGESVSATKRVPTADAPRGAEPDTSSDGAVATPDPIQAAVARRRNGIAVAALAVGGLAVLGTAGLVSAGRLGLSLVVVSTAGKGRAAVGNQPEAMARAALPPARVVAAAPGDVMPGPPAGTGHGAPRHVDSGAWRPPPPSALAERASKFINSYWEQSSASGDEALRYLGSVYAPVVNYYGQQRTRDSVL
jgi:hypothetical protein